MKTGTWMIAECHSGGDIILGTEQDVTDLVLDTAGESVACDNSAQACAAEDISAAQGKTSTYWFSC